MRPYIDLIKNLFEAPGLIGSPGQREDFGLDQPDFNRWVASGLLENGRISASTSDYDLVVSGDDRNGTYGVVDKVSSRLAYLVHFEAQSLPVLGTGVVQVQV